MDALAFTLYGRRAGTITRDGGRLSLEYDDGYLSEPMATPLSLSLPLSGKTHHGRPIEAYLRGLLPDHDEVRRRWAQAFGLRDRDTFGLVAAIGLDCAGGAMFVPEDEVERALSRKGRAEPLTEEQIGSHLRLLRQDEAAWHVQDGEHWSLAGGQSKFTLVKTKHGWARASGSMASTHIVKPGVSRIPAQALTEHVSMRALALLGEQVAQSTYYEFDGEPAIIVERFDRLTALTGQVTRLHSEDLVQSFGLDPSRKYESDGGPGVARISSLLSGLAD
ncbi:MAG: HipA domain-containing protein, partial [Eggerthellaceae bacterium]|nr:HipA domain-containing protein [Eggerthellaceae bacterium]